METDTPIPENLRDIVYYDIMRLTKDSPRKGQVLKIGGEKKKKKTSVNQESLFGKQWTVLNVVSNAYIYYMHKAPFTMLINS